MECMPIDLEQYLAEHPVPAIPIVPCVIYADATCAAVGAHAGRKPACSKCPYERQKPGTNHKKDGAVRLCMVEGKQP